MFSGRVAPNASLEAGRRKAHPQGHWLRVRGLRRRPRERLPAVDGVAHHAADLSRGAGARQGSADFDACHPTVDFDACHSIDSTPFRSREAIHKVMCPAVLRQKQGGRADPVHRDELARRVDDGEGRGLAVRAWGYVASPSFSASGQCSSVL
jgi:hypothetical protein